MSRGDTSAGGKGRLGGEYTYTPNGCSPLHHDDACAHDGCEDDAEWQVDFLVDGDDIKNGHAAFPYCDDHVADYFGYHPDDPEIRTDGGYITCEGCGRNPTRLRKSAWCSQCPEAGGPKLVTDGGTIPEPRGLALRVYNGHKLKPIPYKQSGHGPGPKAWECVGCGRERKEKTAFNKSPCPEPILWVRVGCPGDGLRVCRDCEAVYVGDYERGPFYKRTCIECGSIEVYRDDDPDVEPGLIQASHDGTHRPLHTDNGRDDLRTDGGQTPPGMRIADRGWPDDAVDNKLRWGQQPPIDLTLALIEEVGELADELLQSGRFESAEAKHARVCLSAARDAGFATRSFLESFFEDDNGEPLPIGDRPELGDGIDADAVLEELDDLAPLCYQLAWALDKPDDLVADGGRR